MSGSRNAALAAGTLKAGQADVYAWRFSASEFVNLLDNLVLKNVSFLITETSQFPVRSIAGTGIPHMLFSTKQKSLPHRKKATDTRPVQCITVGSPPPFLSTPENTVAAK